MTPTIINNLFRRVYVCALLFYSAIHSFFLFFFVHHMFLFVVMKILCDRNEFVINIICFVCVLYLYHVFFGRTSQKLKS